MSSIRVDIDDLVNRLNDMLNDDYSIVELVIEEDEYYSNSVLSIKAIDISNDDNVDYGELSDISDEF